MAGGRSQLAAMSRSRMTVDKTGTIVITPPEPATGLVVFTHGFGDTAHGWAEPMGAISNEFPYLKFVLLSAEPIPVTINGGRPMSAWYDIKSMDKSKDDSADGIEHSRDRMLSVIDQEGLPYNRVVIGGFSQGGALSLHTGFHLKKALAGVLVLSSFVPMQKTFALAPEAAEVPLLLCHGRIDPVITFERNQISKQLLENAGVKNIEYKVYPNMRHGTSPQELEDVKDWLHRVLPRV